jgi:hypothetical protein
LRWVVKIPIIHCCNSVIIPVICLFSLAGCGGVFFASAATSAVTVNDIKRYSLPDLEEIDRIEIQNETEFSSRNIVRGDLCKTEEIADLVRILNDNRASWKNPQLVFIPNPPKLYSGLELRILSFWSKNNLVRVVHVYKRTLITQLETKNIIREISQAESDVVYRILASQRSPDGMKCNPG